MPHDGSGWYQKFLPMPRKGWPTGHHISTYSDCTGVVGPDLPHQTTP